MDATKCWHRTFPNRVPATDQRPMVSTILPIGDFNAVVLDTGRKAHGLDQTVDAKSVGIGFSPQAKSPWSQPDCIAKHPAFELSPQATSSWS